MISNNLNSHVKPTAAVDACALAQASSALNQAQLLPNVLAKQGGFQAFLDYCKNRKPLPNTGENAYDAWLKQRHA